MEQYSNNTPAPNEEVVEFDIKKFIKICLNKWWWIAIGLICSIAIALFYIYRKQPEFERYEQILVNDQDSNGGVGEISKSFDAMGLFSKKTNVYNELLTITSPAVMYVVADSLQLYMNYNLKDGLRQKTLYGTNLPVRVDMLDIPAQKSGFFRMKLEPDGSMTLFKFRQLVGEKVVKYEDEIETRLGSGILNTPLGRIKITPNEKFIPESEPKTKVINIQKMAMQNAVELYSSKVKGDLADQDADVIELIIDDTSVERAVDILNYILVVYNQNWINDKNRMAKATSAFIDERLKVIEVELGDVDKTIAEFQKKTGTPDIEASIRTNVEMDAKLNQQLIDVVNQLSVASYMQDFLAKNKDLNTVLPGNIGIDNAELGRQIIAYNDLLLDRNNILSTSSSSNPIVGNYDFQLENLRNAIIKSVDNQVVFLTNSKNTIQKEINKMSSQLANAPEVNLPLLSDERQREVKASLYLFLLQKREENELSQKFSADNVRVITPPVGPLNPISPRKGLILAVAFILGVGIPLVLLYFLDTFNTTIKDKKDLDMLLMPFAGEIPQVGRKANLKQLAQKAKLRKGKDEKPPMSVVEAGKRDVVNEAFRVIRGNLDFMSGKSSEAQAIMVTSFNPGSGKSFVTYNLGMSFCLKNRKVLIIDCDLRHGSSSMYVGMPKTGLTDYLTGANNNWESLVVTSNSNPNLDILPIGKIPPNPAELLEDGKLDTIIEAAKKEYDIIFLDCPPVNIVVDTQIVSQWADRTLFIVRAGLLERSALKELNEFYKEKKFKNISVILNGTAAIHSRYYTYGNYQNLN